ARAGNEIARVCVKRGPMYRRDVLILGVSTAASSLVACAGKNQENPVANVPTTMKPNPTAPSTSNSTSNSIVYFPRFGVNERMIQDALGIALAKGGDYADVFFQHKASRTMALEDGEVNRAYASVDLGVGVRVVKGDQTGYGYTEDLTPAGLQKAA